MDKREFKQGDVYIVDLSDSIGSEQGKIRPCVIVSCNSLNRNRPNIIVASITGSVNKKDMVNYLKTWDLDVQSSLDGKTFDTYESFQAFVVDNLKDNTPILVENVEWGGHWRAIIGL